MHLVLCQEFRDTGALGVAGSRTGLRKCKRTACGREFTSHKSTSYYETATKVSDIEHNLERNKACKVFKFANLHLRIEIAMGSGVWSPV